MSKIPQPFWAVMLALLGTTLATAVLYHPSARENIALAVLGIASSLVSGALGYIAGHASAKSDMTTADGAGNINPK